MVKPLRLNFALAHKRLWLWMAKDPSEFKSTWPEWQANSGKIPTVRSNCFACEAAKIRTLPDADDNICRHCPIGDCEEPYNRVLWKDDPKACIALADLPWKGRKIFTHKNGVWS